MRATRDLLRRRTFLVRRRAELLAHLVNTNSQYNLPPFAKKLSYAANREGLGLPERFADPSVRQDVELDLALLDTCDAQIRAVALYLTRGAKIDDPQAYARLRSIPGAGPFQFHTSVFNAELPIDAALLLRQSEQAKRWLARREQKRGKARAMGALAAKLGRAVYHLLVKKVAFDEARFWND